MPLVLLVTMYIHAPTVEGFPVNTGRSSDDGNDINSSTGIATIVLAVILCLVIVIGVVAFAIFIIKKRSVHANINIMWLTEL